MLWQAFFVICIFNGNCIGGSSENFYVSKALCETWAISVIDAIREEQFPNLIISSFKCTKSRRVQSTHSLYKKVDSLIR